MLRLLRLALSALAATFVLGGIAAAATTIFTLPTPGTATQISSHIASSAKITSIPKDLSPPLDEMSYDIMANTKYHASGQGCPTVSPSCTYGNKTSKHLVVLFGDSHAWMWLAAVNPAVRRNNFRLQLLWRAGCPVATLPQFPNAICNQWRSSTVALIRSEKPTLVLLSERTSHIHTAPSIFMTGAEWTAGLETTIAALKTATTNVAVIGDIPVYVDTLNPVKCLGLFPTAVKKCSTSRLNSLPDWADASAAEKAAAVHEGAGFIDPKPWLCGESTCYEIVGKTSVYYDWSHIAATYSGYLAGVMGSKLHPFL